MDKKLMTQKKACEYLGITQAYFGRLKKEGKEPWHVKLGKRHYYIEEDLDAWVDKQKTKTEGV